MVDNSNDDGSDSKGFNYDSLVEESLKNVVKKVLEQKNILAKQAAFVGNDIQDIEAMKYVGFPISVNDAYPEVHDISIIKTVKKGGFGAVREICDLIYSSHFN